MTTLTALSELLNTIDIDVLIQAMMLSHQATLHKNDMLPYERQVVRDIDLIKACGLHRRIDLRSSLTQQFIAGFLIRHKLAKFSEHCSYNYRTVSQYFSIVETKDVIPLIGFNSIGAFIQWQIKDKCQFLDLYETGNCDHASAIGSVFCEKHISLMKNDETVAGFYRLRKYYLDFDNISSFDEMQLKTLIERFWQTYGAFRSSQKIESKKFLHALSVFSFRADQIIGKDCEKLLRKRYWELCEQHHPDKNGSEQAFIEVAEAYDCLKTAIKI